jgi:transcriptional regulator GlxA family with amidase domain
MMMGDQKKISEAVDKLKANLCETASVQQWANLMGYECPKLFARKFQRYYEVRPNKYLKYLRLKYISEELRKRSYSNFEVARKFGVVDEIALNKYINYHLKCSPTELKMMKQAQIEEKLEKFGSKVR